MRRIVRPMLLAMALMAAGCGAGAPPQGHEAMADPAAMDHAGMDHAAHHHGMVATAGQGYTVHDVEFMQMMIGHHAQALTMATMAPTHGAGADVRTLARRINISQRDEIEMMKRWLAERGQDVPDDEQMHSMRMPGMITHEQFAQLDATRGAEFDRLFLTLMIDHHVGALDMVDNLFAHPGAMQDSEIFQFVTDVRADQMDEIGVMERLLARLETQ